MNDGNKRRSSAELIPLFFSAVLLDIIPIHYCCKRAERMRT